MKKFLSLVLALVMVLATFTMLVPNALAAEETSASKAVYSTDFEYDFGEGVKNSTDKAAILSKTGWSMNTQTSGGTFEVTEKEIKSGETNHALHIANVMNAVIVEDAQLLNGFEMFVDVNLVTAGDGNPIHFAGSRERAGTWNVVIRQEKGILNAPKTNNGANWYSASWNEAAITSFGVWHTLHIIMDPAEGVSVRTKLSTAADEAANWSNIDVYNSTQLEAIPNLNEYLTGIIGVMTFGATTDVYLDNITVNATTPKTETIVYQNDFDDTALASKTGSSLMNALYWKVMDGVAWHSAYPAETLTIQDGAVALTGRSTTDSNAVSNFRVAKDEALLNDYTVTFKMKYQNSSRIKGDIGLTIMGNDGGHSYDNTWLLQLRMNGDVINGGRTSSWYGTNNGVVALEATNYAGTPVDGATYAACDQWYTVTLNVSKTKGNIVTVKNADGVYTYVDGQTAAEITERQTNSLDSYNQYLRFFIFGGVDVLIDDLSVVAYEEPAVSTLLYSEDFTMENTTDNNAILTEIGWTRGDNSGENVLSIVDGRLVANGVGASVRSSFDVLSNVSIPFAEKLVLKYDYEYLEVVSGKESEAVGFWTGASNGGIDGLSVHHRPNGNTLAGARYTGYYSEDEPNKNSWYDIKMQVAPNLSAALVDGTTVGTRFRVRAEISETEIAVYVKDYNKGTEFAIINDLATSTTLGDATQAKMLLNQYLRFICYSGVKVAIDNLTITAENVGAKFYGYQYADNAADAGTAKNIRLVGVINSEMRQKASEVGYKVTMTKVSDGTTATKEISCGYVYSSVTAWGSEPTTPTGMVNCASNIFALHITGVNTAVEIEVTPFYTETVSGAKEYGETKSFTFDPANPPA